MSLLPSRWRSCAVSPLTGSLRSWQETVSSERKDGVKLDDELLVGKRNQTHIYSHCGDSTVMKYIHFTANVCFGEVHGHSGCHRWS